MRTRGLVLALLCFSGAAALHAQTATCGQTFSCPQGSSFSFDFGQYFSQLGSLFAGSGITYTFSFSVGGGTLPPGLTVSSSGLISGTLTTAGTYDFTLNFTQVLIYMGVTYLNETVPFPLDFIVTGYTGPQTTVNPPGLNFNLTQSGAAVTQSISVSNFGSQAAQFSASASTGSGGSWLTISPSSGSTASFGSSSIVVTANPAKLTTGTYSGTVTISVAGGQSYSVPVIAVVTSNQPSMQLSQTGERFEAVSGGTATPPQAITVLNTGAGTLNFSAAAATVSGGGWLVVSPSSGSSTAAKSASVMVSVNPAGLATGDYYGTISFSATGAANSPQIVTVVLNVVSPANSPGALVTPTGLIFVGNTGGTAAAKTISITNPSPNVLTYVTTAFATGSTSTTSPWFTATPASGSVSANSPATVTIQPSLTGLAVGVYTGDLTLNMSSTTSATVQTFHVEILLVVLPSGITIPAPPPGVSSELVVRPRASVCTATKLIPVFTLLGTGFTAAVAWPTALEVTVVDDCGVPLATGSVTATFSNGDPALSLDPLGDGRWTATWNAVHSTTGVTITAQAQEVAPSLNGTASIGGMLQPNTAAPSVSTGGVVSAANFATNQPLAPGAFGAIFGSNLSPNLVTSSQLPLSNQLGSTSVILAGRQLPLLFASGGQVNVVVPYDVPVNSTQQLVVQNGNAISIPQAVVIAPAVPAIFTQNGFGTGSALINVFKGDGTPLPNNSSVSTGYVVVLYCSGLGAVSPPVTAGTATPATPPLSNTVDTVTATIGGLPATVFFSGLTPSFVQLYQVNVIVPGGLPSGPATVVLSIDGQQSAPVTITVQ
jgi:uncharacterized protein (TIGR03437 family)